MFSKGEFRSWTPGTKDGAETAGKPATLGTFRGQFRGLSPVEFRSTGNRRSRETHFGPCESEPDGAVDPALIASGGDGRDSRRRAFGPRRSSENFGCKEFWLQRTSAAKNFGYKESWLQVAIPLVLTSLLDRNDSHLLFEGLILRVGIDPYCHDKTARRAPAGPSAPAVDVSVLVVVLDDP